MDLSCCPSAVDPSKEHVIYTSVGPVWISPAGVSWTSRVGVSQHIPVHLLVGADLGVRDSILVSWSRKFRGKGPHIRIAQAVPTYGPAAWLLGKGSTAKAEPRTDNECPSATSLSTASGHRPFQRVTLRVHTFRVLPSPGKGLEDAFQSIVCGITVLRALALGHAPQDLYVSARPRPRRLLVIANPHSGNGKAVDIWNSRMSPWLDFAGLGYDVVVTDHAGHAIELGRSYDPMLYEGCLCISGDGMVQEFVSGVLSRADWRTLVRRVPLASVACGTANVLAVGLRTSQPEYAAWVLLKRKLRPLDAVLVSNGAGLRTVSLCGIGWGIPADIAAASEAHRWLGTARYGWLKLKYGLSIMLGRTSHTARLEYSADIAMDDVALAAYFAKLQLPVPEGGAAGVAIGQQQLQLTDGRPQPGTPLAAVAVMPSTAGQAGTSGMPRPGIGAGAPGAAQVAAIGPSAVAGGGLAAAAALPATAAVTDHSGAGGTAPHGAHKPRPTETDKIAVLAVDTSTAAIYTRGADVKAAGEVAAAMTAARPARRGVGRVLGRDSLDFRNLPQNIMEEIEKEAIAAEAAAAAAGEGAEETTVAATASAAGIPALGTAAAGMATADLASLAGPGQIKPGHIRGGAPAPELLRPVTAGDDGSFVTASAAGRNASMLAGGPQADDIARLAATSTAAPTVASQTMAAAPALGMVGPRQLAGQSSAEAMEEVPGRGLSVPQATVPAMTGGKGMPTTTAATAEQPITKPPTAVHKAKAKAEVPHHRFMGSILPRDVSALGVTNITEPTIDIVRHMKHGSEMMPPGRVGQDTVEEAEAEAEDEAVAKEATGYVRPPAEVAGPQAITVGAIRVPEATPGLPLAGVAPSKKGATPVPMLGVPLRDSGVAVQQAGQGTAEAVQAPAIPSAAAEANGTPVATITMPPDTATAMQRSPRSAAAAVAASAAAAHATSHGVYRPLAAGWDMDAPITATARPSVSLSPRTALAAGFGRLEKCVPGCSVCATAGRLRYLGHRREAIVVQRAKRTPFRSASVPRLTPRGLGGSVGPGRTPASAPVPDVGVGPLALPPAAATQVVASPTTGTAAVAGVAHKRQPSRLSSVVAAQPAATAAVGAAAVGPSVLAAPVAPRTSPLPAGPGGRLRSVSTGRAHALESGLRINVPSPMMGARQAAPAAAGVGVCVGRMQAPGLPPRAPEDTAAALDAPPSFLHVLYEVQQARAPTPPPVTVPGAVAAGVVSPGPLHGAEESRGLVDVEDAGKDLHSLEHSLAPVPAVTTGGLPTATRTPSAPSSGTPSGQTPSGYTPSDTAGHPGVAGLARLPVGSLEDIPTDAEALMAAAYSDVGVTATGFGPTAGAACDGLMAPGAQEGIEPAAFQTSTPSAQATGLYQQQAIGPSPAPPAVVAPMSAVAGSAADLGLYTDEGHTPHPDSRRAHGLRPIERGGAAIRTYDSEGAWATPLATPSGKLPSHAKDDELLVYTLPAAALATAGTAAGIAAATGAASTGPQSARVRDKKRSVWTTGQPSVPVSATAAEGRAAKAVGPSRWQATPLQAKQAAGPTAVKLAESPVAVGTAPVPVQVLVGLPVADGLQPPQLVTAGPGLNVVTPQGATPAQPAGAMLPPTGAARRRPTLFQRSWRMMSQAFGLGNGKGIGLDDGDMAGAGGIEGPVQVAVVSPAHGRPDMHVWQNLTFETESIVAAGDAAGTGLGLETPRFGLPGRIGIETPAAEAATPVLAPVPVLVPAISAPQATAAAVEMPVPAPQPVPVQVTSAPAAAAPEAAVMVTAPAPQPGLAGQVVAAPPGVAVPAGYSHRGFPKFAESGSYVTIGCVNLGPDAPYSHASDGYLDVVIARKGGIGATIGLLLRYVAGTLLCGVTNETYSPLYGYVKARSITLTPLPKETVKAGAIGTSDAFIGHQHDVSGGKKSLGRKGRSTEGPGSLVCNVDGEVLPGPGPFRLHLMPSLLTAYGEL